MVKIGKMNVFENNNMDELKEATVPYKAHLDTEKATIKVEYMYYWDENVKNY